MMKIATIIITRGGMCHVKTMHTLLRFNVFCIQSGEIQNQLFFTNDDPHEKSETIMKNLRDFDRIFYIDFGVHVDDESLKQVITKNEGMGAIVFPAVLQGINWNMFKERNDEPVNQRGLEFDTEVTTKISEDYYNIKCTKPKAFVLMCKNIVKKIKDKRSGSIKIQPKLDVMFSKFIENSVKVIAFIKANIIVTYQHECIGNIPNAAGVKAY